MRVEEVQEADLLVFQFLVHKLIGIRLQKHLHLTKIEDDFAVLIQLIEKLRERRARRIGRAKSERSIQPQRRRDAILLGTCRDGVWKEHIS